MPTQTGKVAIVSGSTKGIGLAIAERMINEGMSVVVSSRTAAEVATIAEGLGDRAIGIACDVADPADCARLVEETVERFGRLDVLVNNAGLGIFKPISEMSIEGVADPDQCEPGRRLLPLQGCASTPECDRGRVRHQHRVAREPEHVCAGHGLQCVEFGQLGMTEAMMLDVRHDGVRVSIVMPGSVNTHFNNHEISAERSWKLEADDCALAVMQLLEFPKEAHVSRIEMRPSQPGK